MVLEKQGKSFFYSFYQGMHQLYLSIAL